MGPDPLCPVGDEEATRSDPAGLRLAAPGLLDKNNIRPDSMDACKSPLAADRKEEFYTLIQNSIKKNRKILTGK
jgi:hypothetical protein